MKSAGTDERMGHPRVGVPNEDPSDRQMGKGRLRAEQRGKTS